MALKSKLFGAALMLFAACEGQAAAQAVGQTAVGQTAAPARLQLVDLTDDYGRIWAATQQLPEARRPAHFRRAFAKLLPGFYDHKRLSRFGVTDAKYDEFVGKMLKAYPAKRPVIDRVSRDFGAQFGPALASFEAEFGAMTGFPPIYLVHSHNEFDGGTRELPEGTRLIFGADMIGKLYSDRPIQPFFHHELFHLMQSRNFAECDQVWCSLWMEGLAVYAAMKLNPGADDDALLLTSPVPLRPAVEKHRAEAVCAVAARLDSDKGEDYAPLFMGGGKPLSANLPTRFAYYVGLLMVQDLARTRSLKELAALSHSEARPLIGASLARLATCPVAALPRKGERG